MNKPSLRPHKKKKKKTSIFLFSFMAFQVQFDLFVKDSYREIGTSKASMNRTGKTNAARGGGGGVHNNYNEYKDFSDRETEAHI